MIVLIAWTCIGAHAIPPSAHPSSGPQEPFSRDGLRLSEAGGTYPLLPLPPLVTPGDWLDMARRAGLPAGDEMFRETLEQLCAGRRREAATTRQRLFQADFDRAAGLGSTDGAPLEEGRRTLKARVLRKVNDELQRDFDAFRQAVTAAAGRAGALEHVDDAAIASVGMHAWRRHARGVLAGAMPGPFPSFMTTDLEGRLAQWTSEKVLGQTALADAIAAYRQDAQLELRELLAACAAWQGRGEAPESMARATMAKAMDRLIGFELRAIERVAALLDPATAAKLRASELGRFVTPASTVLDAEARVNAVSQTLPASDLQEVGELSAALARARMMMLALHRNAWMEFFQARLHGTDTGYGMQMEGARLALDHAISASWSALQARSAAGISHQERALVLRELSACLNELGAPDETGAWRPTPPPPGWPGDILKAR